MAISNRIPQLLRTLQQPAYTGANRCIPCTLLNGLIAVVISLGLSSISVSLALGTLGVFLVTIYVRGYLIPYTPTITSRYVPAALLRYFDDHSVHGEISEDFDIESALRTANAVVDCQSGTNLCLSDSFKESWWAHITSLTEHDTTRRDLARILGLTSDDIDFVEHGEAFEAAVDGRRIGQWESHPAFIADIAAANELQRRLPSWDLLDVSQRGKTMTGLRIFLDRCPACEGPVSVDREEVKSCCRTIDVLAATCEECGARLFESDQVTV